MHHYSNRLPVRQHLTAGQAGASLNYTPCCEMCGHSPARTISLLDHSPLQLCADCRRLFGFDQVQGVDDGSH